MTDKPTDPKDAAIGGCLFGGGIVLFVMVAVVWGFFAILGGGAK